MTEDTNKNPDGTFKEGNNANPEGKNGHMVGYQRYGTRLERYSQMPFEDLDAIVLDTAKWRKLSAFERSAITQAHKIGSPEHKDHATERELGLNRIEGKASQKVAHGGDPDNPTPIAMDGTFTLTFGTDENDG